MMREPLAFVRPAMVAGACLFGAQAAEAKSPPSLDKTKAALSRLPMCSKQPVVMVNETEELEKIRRRGHAVVVDFCYPAFPGSFLKDLNSRRVTFDCDSLYEVDRDGQASLIDTRCRIASPNGLESDWSRYFEGVIVAAINRTSPRTKFEPARDSEPLLVRQGWVTLNLRPKTIDFSQIQRLLEARPK